MTSVSIRLDLSGVPRRNEDAGLDHIPSWHAAFSIYHFKEYAAAHGVKAMATWEVHEVNVGDQPQWLFDAVNAFLDAP